MTRQQRFKYEMFVRGRDFGVAHSEGSGCEPKLTVISRTDDEGARGERKHAPLFRRLHDELELSHGCGF